MNLLTAAESAKVGVVFSAVRVVRKGKAIDTPGPVATLAVKPGDVVELAHRS
jgi:hypothetical protein